MAEIRVELRVFGRVQGVGFRWATEREALRHGLRGFVRNLDDGSVEIVAEGDETEVAELARWVERGPRHAHVKRIEARRAPATGEFTEFGVY